MSIQRKHSKAVANANHVTWSSRDIIPVTHTLTGLVGEGLEFGILRIAGRPMYCSGFTAYFQTPAADRFCRVSVELQTGTGVVVPNTALALNGVTQGGEKQLSPALPMPANSLWKLVVHATADDPADLPQGLTVTYQLRYANGPLRNDFWANGLANEGIGFWDVDGNFIVA